MLPSSTSVIIIVISLLSVIVIHLTLLAVYVTNAQHLATNLNTLHSIAFVSYQPKCYTSSKIGYHF